MTADHEKQSSSYHRAFAKGAFLHMAADAGVSFGVVGVGIVMMTTGWLWVDPVVSLLVVAIILAGTWSLLRDSMNLAIDAVPGHIDMAGIKEHLIGFEKISR